jgi:hypothetical protein
MRQTLILPSTGLSNQSIAIVSLFEITAPSLGEPDDSTLKNHKAK